MSYCNRNYRRQLLDQAWLYVSHGPVANWPAPCDADALSCSMHLCSLLAGTMSSVAAIPNRSLTAIVRPRQDWAIVGHALNAIDEPSAADPHRPGGCPCTCRRRSFVSLQVDIPGGVDNGDTHSPALGPITATREPSAASARPSTIDLAMQHAGCGSNLHLAKCWACSLLCYINAL